MAKKPVSKKTPVQAEQGTPLIVVKHNWHEMVRMWSNWSGSTQVGIAAFYAATSAAQATVSPTQFASIMAVWGAVNIGLKSLRQENLENLK